MISEANGGDKSYTVTQEQFAQVLTKATNIWFCQASNHFLFDWSNGIKTAIVDNHAQATIQE